MGVKLLGKLKIYELAKKLDMSSKEIIDIAKKLNIEVKNHLSSIEDNEASMIEKSIKGSSTKNAEITENKRK